MNGEQSWFEVALIPEMLERTTLRDLKPGDGVKIECDATVKTIVRTVEQLRMSGSFEC